MTISRIINGTMVNIELSAGELWEAHTEWKKNDDRNGVLEVWDNEYEDNEWRELTDDEIDYIADVLDDFDCENESIGESRWQCIYDAIKEVLK